MVSVDVKHHVYFTLLPTTGAIAFAGCMVYVGMRNKIEASFDGSIGGYLSIFFNVHEWTFAWAFYLAAVGSGLLVVAAIIIAVNNKPAEVTTPPAGGIVMTTVTQNQAAVAAPYAPYAQPQPYAQPGYCGPPPKAGYPGPESYPNNLVQRY